MAKGIGVDIRGSMRSVIRDMWMVQRKYVPLAITRALNDTAKTLRLKAAQQASDATGIPPMIMRKSVMPIGWASRRRMSVPIYLHLWGVPATKLNPKQQGSDVALRKTKPKQTLVDSLYFPPEGRNRYGSVVRDKNGQLEFVALEHAKISQPILDAIMRTQAGPTFKQKFTSRMARYLG